MRRVQLHAEWLLCGVFVHTRVCTCMCVCSHVTLLDLSLDKRGNQVSGKISDKLLLCGLRPPHTMLLVEPWVICALQWGPKCSRLPGLENGRQMGSIK